MSLLLSCEHGGHRVPAFCAAALAGQSRVLRSHRGWDGGAALAARQLAATLRAPLQLQTVSRLVVDCNRSPHHPALFSPWSRALSAAQRARVLQQIYLPHRQAVYGQVAATTAPVLHLAIHSFVPVLHGRRRSADVGLLFDPRRPREAHFAAALQQRLRAALPQLQVRRNSPYRGTADGLPTALRQVFDDRHYAGLEIEINQRLRGLQWRVVVQHLATAVAELIFFLHPPCRVLPTCCGRSEKVKSTK